MRINLRIPAVCLAAGLAGLLLAAAASAQSSGSLTLQDALAAALQHGAGQPPSEGAAPPYEASSWLAGLPSVGLVYLDSEERYGTDEAELNINLPLKSGRRRKADSALQGLAADLDALARRERELFYSGLIREAVWSYRLADTRRRFAADKRRLLLQLEQRQEALLAANASSEYALLLLQTERVGVEIAQQEHLQEARRWLLRYQQVTGLDDMPADLQEAAPHAEQFAPGQHPSLQALELAHQQRRQLLRAGSAQAEDWNLSVIAKNFETAGYEEQQYGLGLEIPLSSLDIARQSDNSEWRAAERDYLIARDQVLNELRGSWEQLLNEQDMLQQKQQLLQRSEQLATRIADQLAQLQASNEIAQEIVLRRMMDAIDTRAEVAINGTLIDQNNAMLRQAAGLSL